MAAISIYKNVKEVTSTETVLLSIFLDAIQSGKWQDQVLKIRTITDKDLRSSEKIKLPNVTISGVFGKRVDADCKQHSGFIAIDIDNLGTEVESTRELLKTDPYIYSIFTSVSGTGLCAIVKIDPEKHREAFEGIANYLLIKYQVTADPTGVNPSRTRFVSFDPDLYINEKSAKFKKYLPKQKKRDLTTTIFVQTEFDEIVNKMVEQKVDCCDDYRDWRDIAFGLFDQFGKAGFRYFDALSRCSDKYDETVCGEMWGHAGNRSDWNGKRVTIATIYWHAKNAGINIYSEQTKKVVSATSTMKKAGLDANTIASNLKKFEGIEGVEEIIKQAFSSNASFTGEGTMVENVRMWLRHNYNLTRNMITRKIENDGEVLTEVDFNTMYLDALIIFEKLTFDLFFKVIMSHNTGSYNPITDFIKSIEWDGENRIDQLGACINSKTGTVEWRCLMTRRWYIGVVSSVFGYINELNFILVGGKNTGKTWFFSELLPPELQPYFGRSQLMRGTDDEILMCEKMIILNDEYGGKGNRDERNEKRIMAAPGFDVRAPYGRGNEFITRIASLCGTCNDLGVLDDATGNRRIVVMESVGRFDFNLYNSLDKYQLLAEAYAMVQKGERPKLKDEEIDELEAITDGQYSKVVIEGELIQQHFLPPSKTNPWDHMTATQIKVFLENHTRNALNINKIGAQLKKLGYTRSKKEGTYGYDISSVPVIVSGG